MRDSCGETSIRISKANACRIDRISRIPRPRGNPAYQQTRHENISRGASRPSARILRNSILDPLGDRSGLQPGPLAAIPWSSGTSRQEGCDPSPDGSTSRESSVRGWSGRGTLLRDGRKNVRRSPVTRRCDTMSQRLFSYMRKKAGNWHNSPTTQCLYNTVNTCYAVAKGISCYLFKRLDVHALISAA